ncbi:hypothetical protein [Pseudonocardia alaniniphila]|uniref:Uncharacterized protein n=1 Tax=Pseudonocardia alaniniphila TaxID=75291 RepID=A0ABS9TCT8_9PSEU|nr:hypothetical protein [Pseudonocardia alaniniphila]MCH6166350.1 hypothetical protein [Pseudonocardia alaniniphila]
MLGLPRSAGNAAVVAAMWALEGTRDDGPAASSSEHGARSGPLTSVSSTALSAHANPYTIQRAARDDSDPDLKAIYDELVTGSQTFRMLDAQLAESHGQIRLIDSLKLFGRQRGAVAYVGNQHAIMAPAGGAHPNALRSNLMWEMHNALNRGEAVRTGSTFAPHLPRSMGGPPMPTLEQARAQKYYVAARALAIEWDEWATVIEADLNSLKVNFELANSGDTWRDAIDDNLNFLIDGAGNRHPDLEREVQTPFISSFSTADPRSWRDFSNYLEKQLRMNHTTGYDVNARSRDWIGRKMLEIVEDENHAALLIGKPEIRDFLEGRTRKVKPGFANPFKNTYIVERVVDLDTAASAGNSGNPLPTFSF